MKKKNKIQVVSRKSSPLTAYNYEMIYFIPSNKSKRAKSFLQPIWNDF